MEKQFKNLTNLTSPTSSITPKSQADRIRQIEQKLQYISQAKTAQQRQQKTNTLSTRITNMQKSYADMFWKLENQLKEQRELLKELNREYEENRSEQELSLKNRIAEINQIQGRVNNLWKIEMQKVKEGEKKVIALYEEKIETLRLQILKQIEKRKMYFASFDEKLSDKLPSLQFEISQKMEESGSNLLELEKQISQETEIVCKTIKQSQVTQIASFEELMRMMGSVIAEIKQQIAQEKENRLLSKKKLLALFEGAYSRLSN